MEITILYTENFDEKSWFAIFFYDMEINFWSQYFSIERKIVLSERIGIYLVFFYLM